MADPVVVIGAGPVGLAAAAIDEWRHVKLFSPWRYDVDTAARRLLERTGWAEPDLDALPTGGELIDAYLAPLAKTPQLNDRIRYNSTVTAITRVGFDRVRTAGRDQAPFLVRLADGTELHASAVIDASGTWRLPNVLGGSGIPARGETDAAAGIARALPDVLGRDRDRFAGRRTAVVGAGHSAATTLLELGALAEEVPDTEIVWVVRGSDQARTYGGGDDDELPARGALGTRLKKLVQTGHVELVSNFRIEAVRRDGRIELMAGDRTVVADTVVNSTGFRLPSPATTRSARSRTAEPRPSCWRPATNRPARWSQPWPATGNPPATSSSTSPKPVSAHPTSRTAAPPTRQAAAAARLYKPARLHRPAAVWRPGSVAGC